MPDSRYPPFYSKLNADRPELKDKTLVIFPTNMRHNKEYDVTVTLELELFSDGDVKAASANFTILIKTAYLNPELANIATTSIV